MATTDLNTTIRSAQILKHTIQLDDISPDALVFQEPVEDKDLTAPPGGESEGDRYIVASVATGAYAGQEKKIAQYINSSYSFYTPLEGWITWVKDENCHYVYNGSSWDKRDLSELHTVNEDTALGAQSEDLDMNTHKITGVVDPVADQDAETKKHTADNFAPIDSPTFTTKITTPIIDLTGGQIKFPSTAVPSADPNTMDDYEEGDYTPLLTNITIGDGSVTGKYLKIGKFVYFKIYLTCGSTTSIGTDPSFSLPFTSSSATGWLQPVCTLGDYGTADYMGLVRLITTTTARIYITNVAGTYPTQVSVTATVPFTWAENDLIAFMGIYESAN